MGTKSTVSSLGMFSERYTAGVEERDGSQLGATSSPQHRAWHVGGIWYMSEWFVDDTSLGSPRTNKLHQTHYLRKPAGGMQDPELEAGESWEKSRWPAEALSVLMGIQFLLAFG